MAELSGWGSLQFGLHWRSETAQHSDYWYAEKVNFWRDIFPDGLLSQLQAAPESRAEVTLRAGEHLPEYEKTQRVNIRPKQFNSQFARGRTLEARRGRFYPKGILLDVHGVYKEDMSPCRCLEVDENQLRFDLNHPLAAYPLRFSAELKQRLDIGGGEHGGRCQDWVEETAQRGPGMQACWQDTRSDFFQDGALQRMDERDDAQFYTAPRLVPHIDSAATEVIRTLYADLLQPGMRVLDLMSSWQSHLPEDLELAELVGLGMNAEELAQNPRLSQRDIQDLNQNPQLPYADAAFDAVICNLSIEYLTQPAAVFESVARVLKPGGLLITTFSNRWFPSKAIQLWGELHEFERMGLVQEYYLRNGAFQNLHTFSLRGLPRPEDDKYAAQMAQSDPVFAVWAEKI